jgi:poly(hydroxyalkanoate) granule-associated protein
MSSPTDDPEDSAGRREARAGRSAREQASEIWLAGLGAFAKAQEQGGKVFEALVKEGAAMQRKTQAAAEEKLSEASQRMSSMAGDMSSRAAGHWDKLETLFEERVSKALRKLGVPMASEVETLAARVKELEREVEELRATQRDAGTLD